MKQNAIDRWLQTFAGLTIALAAAGMCVSPAANAAPNASAATTTGLQTITTPQQYREAQRIVGGYKYSADSGLFVTIGDYIVTAYGDTWAQKETDLLNGEIDLSKPSKAVNNNFMLTRPDGTVVSMFNPETSSSSPVEVPLAKRLGDANTRNFYWPTGMTVLNGKIYVTMQHEITSSGGMGFEPVGTDLATFSIYNNTLRFDGLTELPTVDGNSSAVQWGEGYVQDSTYVYIYGGKKANRYMVFGDDYSVARVLKKDFRNLGKWQYKGANGWTYNKASAVVTIPGELGAVSAILPEILSDGTTRFITKNGGGLGSEVLELSAPNPSSTFSVSRKIADVPGYNDPNGSGMNYLAFRGKLPNGVHAEMISKQGTGNFNLNGYGVFLLQEVATQLY